MIAKIPVLGQVAAQINKVRAKISQRGFDPFQGKVSYNRNLTLFKNDSVCLYASKPRVAYKRFLEHLAHLLDQKPVRVLYTEISFPLTRDKSDGIDEHYMFLLLEYAVSIYKNKRTREMTYGFFPILRTQNNYEGLIKLYTLVDANVDPDVAKELLRQRWNSHGVMAFFNDQIQGSGEVLSYERLERLELFLKYISDEIRNRYTDYVCFYDFMKECDGREIYDVFTSLNG